VLWGKEKMKKLLITLVLMLASCGDPCNCDNINIDPFNSSPLPNGCGCSVGKIYVPDLGVDIAEEVTGTKAADMHTAHKIKN
jgi:hypothetical protein